MEMEFGPIPMTSEEHSKCISRCIENIEAEYIRKQFGPGHREGRKRQVVKKILLKFGKNKVKIQVRLSKK